MRQTISVLAATLVVAASTGCAGDDDGGEAGGTTTAVATTTAAPETTSQPPTTDPTATRPEPPSDQSRWARQADAACEPWQERIQAVAQPTDAASLKAWLTETLPLVRKQVAAVKAVQPPANAAAARQVRLFVQSLEQLEEALTRYRSAALANRPAAIEQALVDANTAGVAARGHAMSLGVTGCGGYSSG